jgi:hypothetical protein
MMKNLFIGIVLFLSCGFILGFACDWYVSIDHHSDENVKPPKDLIVKDSCYIDTLKELVLKGKGDEGVCSNLGEEYMDIRYYQQEFLLYSLIMANKFNIPDGYYFVYKDWTGIYNIHFRGEKMDDKTKKIVIDYLKRGVELNNYGSIIEMKDICQK